MKVILGKFTRSGLEAVVGRDVAAGLSAALAHYIARLRRGQAPVDPPAFLEPRGPESGDAVYDVPLDSEVERALEEEARKQGESLQRLAVHAVLVYLADVDRAGGGRPDPGSADLQLLGR